MRLHGHAGSINVRKVLWLVAELGLEVELIERGTTAAPVSDPAYLALNRFGMVPLLEDGERVLAESNSILRYLARREGRDDLLPNDAFSSARVERWMDWQATDFNDSWRYSFMARFRDKPGYDDPRCIAQSRDAFNAKVAIIDAQLVLTGAYIESSTFTLADIPIGLSIRRWLAFQSGREACPNVMAYYGRLCHRPAFLRFGGPESPP